MDERSHYTLFTAFKELFKIRKPDQKVAHQAQDNGEKIDLDRSLDSR